MIINYCNHRNVLQFECITVHVIPYALGSNQDETINTSKGKVIYSIDRLTNASTLNRNIEYSS